MGIIKMMCIGKSGVGKSTIGNCMVDGSPTGTAFVTDSSATSVTKEPKWVNTEDCHYCDVPGLPDTDPKNTKSFYDMIIKEARKALDVLLFVFKYERICVDDYKRAKMLFRELMKSKASKVLVINDMTNYAFGATKKPSEDDYKKEADAIQKCLGIEFVHTVVIEEATMMTNLNHLKEQLIAGKTKSVFSPDLKTYDELKEYVEKVTKERNIREIAYIEAKDEAEHLKSSLAAFPADMQPAISDVLNLVNPSSFFSDPIGTINAVAASESFNLLINMKKEELKMSEGILNDKDLLDKASKKLEDACESFKDLDEAIGNTSS